mgnify:CR=1 FL=1
MKVSICIPTMNRAELLKKTLDSIVFDGVNKDLYEVIISDNSENSETLDLVNGYSGVNIIYIRNDEKGFYNSINALIKSTGDFLKLHNDYTTFLPNEFNQFIEDVGFEYDKDTTVLFTNGELNKSSVVDNFNDFINHTSFYSTWSSAFSITSHQLSSVNHQKDDVDEMFPHTSLLFNLVANRYIINNHTYFKNTQVEKKGGYNIFYNFGVLFLDMLEREFLKGRISNRNFKIVKIKLLVKFLAPWYYKTVETKQGYTFDTSNVKQHITTKFGVIGYVLIVSLSKINRLLKLIGLRK